MERSFITKNSTDPLIETLLYWLRVFSIFYSKTVDSSIFNFISSEVSLELSRVDINSTSSKRVSGLLSFNIYKISFSHSVILFLYPAKLTILSSLYFSIMGYSFLTTSANSWSSNPSKVTVKLIILTCL